MKGDNMDNNGVNRIRILRSVIITDEDIDDIMATALDGGISYWCSKAEVADDEYYGEYASDQISRGGSLILYDPFKDKSYILTKDDLLEGFVIAYSNGYANSDDWVIDNGVYTGDIDAIAADCIVQCAIFKDVVYG